MRRERSGDHIEVGDKRRGSSVRRHLRVRRSRRLVAAQRLGRRRESRVDADQCLPIWLVAAVWIKIVRRGGQRGELRRRRDQPHGERELGAELVHFA